ncbi:MAG: bifunctional glutamate N-acetyltransferase/amino-acid acetyltransferase ArgJ [Endomicrobiales bacterium]|nr:bifunctional glutamate N-acetyltransferase/amino-acid acetyltransferase ArgJ [Endomicrobiales bacterium]
MLPKGFIVNGVRCGIYKKAKKEDLALFYSNVSCAAAGLFTSNVVKAAPVIVSERHLKKTRGEARAVIANAGCANCCTGKRGEKDALFECRLTAEEFSIRPEEVLVASTGVIGSFMQMDKLAKGIDLLSIRTLENRSDPASGARAIMTTDTVPKVSSKKVFIGTKTVTLWAAAKGSGMMHPKLKKPHATMLAFILTDAAVEKAALDRLLLKAADNTLNKTTVDGDTSTNDALIMLANGLANNPPIAENTKHFYILAKAVNEICADLARKLARDGEGATKLIEVNVINAPDQRAAEKVAETVATSNLFKTAMFGNDANWGRIMAAAGRSGVHFNPEKTEVSIGRLTVFRNGMPTDYSEAKAKRILRQKEVTVLINLNRGKGSSRYYTCDLSCDYVKINASYRS